MIHPPSRILFAPHTAYHVANMAPLVPSLLDAGMECTFVDTDTKARDEGVGPALRNHGLEGERLRAGLLPDLKPHVLVTMNDWGVTRRLVEEANDRGVATVGIVEGVQDFEDTHVEQLGLRRRIRQPYRRSQYALLVGDFDRAFFEPASTRVVGIPRIEALFRRPPVRRDRPLVAINQNFTYGLFTDIAQEWLDQAVAACRQLDFDCVVTQHHADRTDTRDYPVAKGSLHQVLGQATILLSRFSTCLYEAMACGTPCVYFNPHHERMATFLDPRSAYLQPETRVELVEALQEAATWSSDYRSRCRAYLEHHVSFDAESPAQDRAAEAILEIASIPRPSEPDYGRWSYRLDCPRRIVFIVSDTEARITINRNGWAGRLGRMRGTRVLYLCAAEGQRPRREGDLLFIDVRDTATRIEKVAKACEYACRYFAFDHLFFTEEDFFIDANGFAGFDVLGDYVGSDVPAAAEPCFFLSVLAARALVYRDHGLADLRACPELDLKMLPELYCEDPQRIFEFHDGDEGDVPTRLRTDAKRTRLGHRLPPAKGVELERLMSLSERAPRARPGLEEQTRRSLRHLKNEAKRRLPSGLLRAGRDLLGRG